MAEVLALVWRGLGQQALKMRPLFFIKIDLKMLRHEIFGGLPGGRTAVDPGERLGKGVTIFDRDCLHLFKNLLGRESRRF